MNLLTSYILPRVGQFAVVVFIGLTVAFMAPRLGPLDPVVATLDRVMAYGGFMEPAALEALKASMIELYGLEGSPMEHYVRFWKRLVWADFGPSLMMFPTPVSTIILNALPWTVGLLTVAVILSWTIGNILGGFAGYFHERGWSKVLGFAAMVVYPIPYYVMALIMVMLSWYLFGWFSVGGYGMGLRPSMTPEFILSVLRNAFLPALSLVIVSIGWWFLSMRSLASSTASEDYVVHAEMMGLPRSKLLLNYVMRNSMLPQVTNLSFQLGGMFSGSLVAEYVFSYPGLGFLVYTAINNADFNLMMGIVSFSIIGVALAALLVDLLYPLVDPRIRYR